jgi:succinoglycan biosynthesis transport protein ExoP
MRVHEPTLSDYLDALRRSRGLIIFIGAVVLALLVPLSLGLPNLYRASASLVVDQLPDTLSGSDRVGEVDGRLQAIKQEALSRQRITELIEQFNLYPELRAQGHLDDVIARAQKDVKVEITSTNTATGNPTTVAFTVSYLATNPEIAARVANQLAAFYVQQNDAMRSKQATRNAALLKTELDATKAKLDAEEGRIIAFAGSNTGSLPQQINSTMTKYTQIAQQVQANTSEEMQLTARRDDLENRISDLMTPRANADSSDPRLKLLQAQKELDALRLEYSPNHPDVKNKLREIATLQAQVGQMKPGASTDTAQLTTLQNQLAEVKKKLEDTKAAGERLRTSMAQFDTVLAQAPVRDAEFDRISNDVRTTRDAYDALSKRYQDALLAERAEEGTGAEEFHIVDPAAALKSPAGPNRLLLVGGSVALAFGLGLVVALVRARFDDSFRTVDDLRAFTQVPVLATIPRIATSRERTRHVAATTCLTAATAAVLIGLGMQVFYLAQRSEAIARLLMR